MSVHEIGVDLVPVLHLRVAQHPGEVDEVTLSAREVVDDTPSRITDKAPDFLHFFFQTENPLFEPTALLLESVDRVSDL